MSATIPNLQQRRIMLSFAYLAYCGEEITTPNPEQTILKYINTAMPKIPPISTNGKATWKVVWGPAVYTVPGAKYQDNLMFVAQSLIDPSQYAIAIRGTNGISQLDFILEDFDIMEQMNWPLGAATPKPAGAMVSESTSIDMHVLLSMQGTVANGSKQYLFPFLMSQTEISPTERRAINVCVTGHSLGGCLAGTLALYLKENRSFWDLSHRSNISAVTFAGPTAGNAQFAKYTNDMFNSGPYPPNWDVSLGSTFDAVRCNYDIVVQGWIASNLSQQDGDGNNISPLFATYGDNLKFEWSKWTHPEYHYEWQFVLDDVLPPIAASLTTQNYQQPMSGVAQLQGIFNTSLKPSGDGPMVYMTAFKTQGVWQHSNSYPSILGVPALQDPNIIRRS